MGYLLPSTSASTMPDLHSESRPPDFGTQRSTLPLAAAFIAMTTLSDIKQTLYDEMPYLRERYHVDQIGICGSFVRGDQTPESDVDLLVTFSETPTLYEFVNLKRYLERSLDRKVDLGMPSALKDGPAADNIRREVQYLS